MVNCFVHNLKWKRNTSVVIVPSPSISNSGKKIYSTYQSIILFGTAGFYTYL